MPPVPWQGLEAAGLGAGAAAGLLLASCRELMHPQSALPLFFLGESTESPLVVDARSLNAPTALQ
jgi:hypothetical protein